MKEKLIVGFGEALWDMLPEGRHGVKKLGKSATRHLGALHERAEAHGLRAGGKLLQTSGVGNIVPRGTPTPKVEVADTVGAGDSFTATFVASLLRGFDMAGAHRRAVTNCLPQSISSITHLPSMPAAAHLAQASSAAYASSALSLFFVPAALTSLPATRSALTI